MKLHQTEIFKNFVWMPIVGMTQGVAKEYGWPKVIIAGIFTLMVAGIAWNLTAIRDDLKDANKQNVQQSVEIARIAERQRVVLESLVESKTDRSTLHHEIQVLSHLVQSHIDMTSKKHNEEK